MSEYDIDVKYAVLHALLPPVLQFANRSIFVESLFKMPNFWLNFTATQPTLI